MPQNAKKSIWIDKSDWVWFLTAVVWLIALIYSLMNEKHNSAILSATCFAMSLLTAVARYQHRVNKELRREIESLKSRK